MARIAFCKNEMLGLQVGPIENPSCFVFSISAIMFYLTLKANGPL